MTFKPLSQRKKDELLKLFEDFSIDLPDVENPTNKFLVNVLEQAGVTNKALRTLNVKSEQEEQAASMTFDGMSVVCMDRDNASFQFKKFLFTRDRKYILMPEEDAQEIVNTIPGFRKAGVEEVSSYYKQ